MKEHRNDKRNGGKKHATEVNNLITGKISININGLGFVGIEGGSVFVPPSMHYGAITGDTVQVQIDPNGDPARPSGWVTAVLERRHSRIVGCLVPGEEGEWFIRPLRRELPGRLPVDPASIAKLAEPPAEGIWAMAELPLPAEDAPLHHRGCTAWLVDTMGRNGQVAADLDAVVAEFGLPEMWSEADEARAAALEPLKVRRKDCTDLTCVTIDPVDARDYDDALSCEESDEPEVYVVGVHIADVACYIRRGGWLDRQARRRGFTSYLPGRTIPMLPKALANVQCSLQAGVPRLAHTVFIHYNCHTGDILKVERCHTLINVSRRLCYEEVQRYFDGGQVDLPEKITQLLDRLGSMAAILRHRRQFQERFLPMEMPEIRVLCAGSPLEIIGLQRGEDNPSHQLVEEFMLAANQCVAQEMLERRLPGIYRNHQAPDPNKLGEFVESATIMMGKKVKSLSSRRGIVRFLKDAARSPLRDVLLMAFLRHLPRAEYEAQCLGHFGLGKEQYCHFTSPIRRYADTLVHQQLLAWDNRRKIYDGDTVAQIAQECTMLEQNVDQAAFAAQDRMKIRLIQRDAAKSPTFRLSGEVCRVMRAGIQLYLPEYGLMAFANEGQLPRSHWLFDALKQEWRNTHTGERLFVSKRADFTLDSADPIRGEILLRPENTPKEAPAVPKGAAGRRRSSSAGMEGFAESDTAPIVWGEPEWYVVKGGGRRRRKDEVRQEKAARGKGKKRRK